MAWRCCSSGGRWKLRWKKWLSGKRGSTYLSLFSARMEGGGQAWAGDLAAGWRQQQEKSDSMMTRHHLLPAEEGPSAARAAEAWRTPCVLPASCGSRGTGINDTANNAATAAWREDRHRLNGAWHGEHGACLPSAPFTFCALHNKHPPPTPSAWKASDSHYISPGNMWYIIKAWR